MSEEQEYRDLCTLAINMDKLNRLQYVLEHEERSEENETAMETAHDDLIEVEERFEELLGKASDEEKEKFQVYDVRGFKTQPRGLR